MSARIKILNKIFLFVCIYLCNSIFAFAAENSLTGINVKQVGESSYDVMLKLSNSTGVQKIINADDSLTLVLKETEPTDSMEIIYDNASDLDNVIVQKKSNGDTVILLEGKNIENANVFTNDLSSGTTLQSNNGGFVITDKKTLLTSIFSLIAFFVLMLSRRPKNRRYNSNAKNIVQNKKVVANTLRNKNVNQSKNIPSINYKVNGTMRNMSIPKEFVINNQVEEKIRKVS